jgi:hypothetical protein
MKKMSNVGNEHVKPKKWQEWTIMRKTEPRDAALRVPYISSENLLILLPVIQLSRNILPPARFACKMSAFIKMKNRHI